MKKLTRNWKIHLIHHTHLDIGYTHTQEEVLQRQFSHTYRALDLIDMHRENPEYSQFRWNPEVTWAIKPWYDQATSDDRNRFISMIQSGHIGIDGLYGNLLTGLCRPQELKENFYNAQFFADLAGIPVTSAMITDIPGWNWGLVTALANQGIQYLSAGPNHFDRIGYTLEELGDAPFYWVSPSGKERVLLYTHGKGYAWFHTSLNSEGKKNKLTSRRIFSYLHQLEKKDYPYDTVLIRYNIGGDNGPPDPNISSIVEAWNRTYPQIQIRLSTTSQAMEDFENSYGNILPSKKGDITPYWEDGAFSSARETAIARETSERMSQIQSLSSILHTSPEEPLFRNTWEQVLLYNEHTWGAYNSISKPDHTFAQSQWEWKKERALFASRGSKKLIEIMTQGSFIDQGSYERSLLRSTSTQNKLLEDGNSLCIYNTHQWSLKNTLVTIESSHLTATDQQRISLPSQKLTSGSQVYLIDEIPALGHRTYKLSNRLVKTEEDRKIIYPCMIQKNTLTNGLIKVDIHPTSGTIRSIQYNNTELVDTTTSKKFNQYILLTTKYFGIPKSPKDTQSVSIEIVENGPLVASLRIQRKVPRCINMITDISIQANSKNIYLSNTLIRPKTRKKEGIHFEFPFNFSKGKITYDTLWGFAELNKDQLPASNKNFITATRWVDISNKKNQLGVTCILQDAPIFKSGNPHKDPRRSGKPEKSGWMKRSPVNGTIYSYVMNNYWMTNYKADQPGATLFRYVFVPHEHFDTEEADKRALETNQPPIVILKEEHNKES